MSGYDVGVIMFLKSIKTNIMNIQYLLFCFFSVFANAFENDECPICMVPFFDEDEGGRKSDIVQTVCKHQFCVSCLEQWILAFRGKDASCPACRGVIDKDFQVKHNVDVALSKIKSMCDQGMLLIRENYDQWTDDKIRKIYVLLKLAIKENVVSYDHFLEIVNTFRQRIYRDEAMDGDDIYYCENLFQAAHKSGVRELESDMKHIATLYFKWVMEFEYMYGPRDAPEGDAPNGCWFFQKLFDTDWPLDSDQIYKLESIFEKAAKGGVEGIKDAQKRVATLRFNHDMDNEGSYKPKWAAENEGLLPDGYWSCRQLLDTQWQLDDTQLFAVEKVIKKACEDGVDGIDDYAKRIAKLNYHYLMAEDGMFKPEGAPEGQGHISNDCWSFRQLLTSAYPLIQWHLNRIEGIFKEACDWGFEIPKGDQEWLDKQRQTLESKQLKRKRSDKDEMIENKRIKQ